MHTEHFINGRKVDFETYITEGVRSYNEPIIRELERQLEDKADAYYKAHPDEKKDAGYLLHYHLRTIDVYAETPEGSAFIEQYLKKHPLKTVHNEAGCGFFIFSAIIIGSIIAIICIINS